MGNILEMAELVWRSLNPNSSSQSSIKKEEVISAAIQEYSSAMWIFSKEEDAAAMGFEIPSDMLTTVELPVKDNQIDISGLDILDSLSNDQAIQNVGGIFCDCRYLKSSLNTEQKLRGDDSAGNAKTFFKLGKKLVFPRGTHKDKLEITYANSGSGLDPDVIEANSYVLSRVRDKLYQIYGIKVPEDATSNSNSNN